MKKKVGLMWIYREQRMVEALHDTQIEITLWSGQKKLRFVRVKLNGDSPLTEEKYNNCTLQS